MIEVPSVVNRTEGMLLTTEDGQGITTEDGTQIMTEG